MASRNRRTYEWLYLLLALGAGLASFVLSPWLLLPSQLGLYGWLRYGSPGQLLAKSLLWGVLYAGSFHHWLLLADPKLWCVGLPYRAGVWILLALPLLALRRALGRKGATPSLEALAWSCGMVLVTKAQLATQWGFDWEIPVASLAPLPWTLSLLPWIGLPGISGLLALAAALLAGPKPTSRLAGVVWLALWLLVSQGVSRQPQGPSERTLPSAALLQTGWARDQKWANDNREPSKARLFELTTLASQQGAELVIWPETAWPEISLLADPAAQRSLSALAQRLGVTLLVTSLEAEPEGWMNTASHLSADGAFEAHYRKRRLLPLVETTVWPDPLLRALPQRKRPQRFVAGDQAPLFDGPGYRYAPLICYESTVPWISAELAPHVDFFVVVTNDANLESHFAREAHFRSAVLRAIECRRPVWQAGNDGVTGFIDARGVVLRRTARGATGPTVLLGP